MKKPFTDVFPNLKCDGSISFLLPYFSVRSMRYGKGREALLIRIVSGRLIPGSVFRMLEQLIREQYLNESGIEVRILEEYELPAQFGLTHIMEEYRETLLQELSEEGPLFERFLKGAEFTAEEPDLLTIRIEDHLLTRRAESRFRERLLRIFHERFLLSLRISFDYFSKDRSYLQLSDDTMVVEAPVSAARTTDDDSEELITDAPAKAARKERTGKAAGSLRKGGANRGRILRAQQSPENGEKEADPDLIYGRRFSGEPRSILSCGNDEGEVIIEGEIFNFESRPQRNGQRSILSFALTDLTDSVSVKLFVDNADVPRLSDALQNGKSVLLRGLMQYDSYEHETSVRAFGILKNSRSFRASREDTAPVKRVELHCHTKASMLDAVTDVTELIRTARSFGHPALAITDHGCVYAFPDAYHALKKDDPLKLIYGMEAYLVDDLQEFVAVRDDRPLSAPAVVFDLETTGFSPVNNRIIEIGAVKIEDGEITGHFSTFVDPGIPIPYRIEHLTHISDAMVKGAPSIEQALPDFLRFIDGAVLVAQNASFDLSFLYENIRRLGLPPQDFNSVDTVGISRKLLPHLGRFNLEALAKELKVPLLSHHRAVDDAECTAKIYLKLLEMLKLYHIGSLQELKAYSVPDPETIRKMPAYHAVILAANETGRVNLYHLVTESNLTYFERRPRIPKTLLNHYREGLILGSACSAGELYNAILRGETEDEVRRIAGFYDYLEIQPVGNDLYLIDEDRYDVHSEEDLREINRRICTLGEEMQKPVCATTDAHFLNPEDEIYRTILQAGCGYKENDSHPPLYFRTTNEMLSEFDYLGAEKAYEVVVTNTNLIADRIERIAPVRADKCPPVIENADQDLKNICYGKARELYGDPLPEIVEKRLSRELDAIISNGYAVMYIIAQKLVNKSVSDGYLVGSRGSVGSSFAATMAGITEVNPLKPHYRCPSCHYSDFDSEYVQPYEQVTGCDMPDRTCPVCGRPLVKDGYNIPFETFLGFNGNKEPDIDLNFSGDYQAKAHAYTEVIFGKGQTFKAGTIGTVQEKSAAGFVRHYFEEKGIDKRQCEISRLAVRLTGVRRTSSQHPGGIIVLPYGEDINSFTPVQHPADDKDSPIITTHFDYHSIDQNLLKLDILGHDDPTMIRMLYDLTGIDPRTFPLDSKEVMSLFQGTEALGVTPEEIRGCKLGTLGLPEFGTENAINMLLEAKPQSVSDLIRVSGLAHGTNVWHGNAELLIKEGTCTIATAVCTRDDIMTYLIECGLENALSFKIMEAVRKGTVAKGKCADWENWKQEMSAHGVPDWYIWSCEHIEYMFPKAHAAAYVMMALRIAYCKIFYPLAYYCAYFSIRAKKSFSYRLSCRGPEELVRNIEQYEANKDRLSETEKDLLRDMRICQEMYARGYRFVPLDLYQADATRFRIMDDRSLMPSFMSISGMGDVAAMQLQQAAKAGSFTSMKDVKNRGGVSQAIIDEMEALDILRDLPKDDQLSLFDHFGS